MEPFMTDTENQLLFQDKEGWRNWLQHNHASEKEALLVIKKSNAAVPGVSYEESVEEALCFGWIDGVMKSTSAETFVLRYSPRKKGSPWSVSNQKRVERLIEQGRMTEAGMARVREAHENGEWEAAIRREDVTNIPQALREALSANPKALENFEKVSPSQKKQFFYWIDSAKTDATRQKRIQETVRMIENNIRIG
jgi:uncharacterized protein YdeI (YjbR/CyaY-like superfamily)